MSYDHPVAQELIAELDEDMVRRYGGRDAAPVSSHDFSGPSGTFLVLQDARGPIGCAGVRTNGADAEIKRMFVRPERRREGHARRLLVAIEEYVRTRGLSRVILETGTPQSEAVALYERAGFLRIPPFGHHRQDPRTRCYAKWL